MGDGWMSEKKSLTKMQALFLSLLAISSAFIVESVIAIAVNSLAILSDAVHALFDVVTTFILLLTTHLALKPPDKEHTYGHGKIESVGGLVGGISLLALSGVLVGESILRIISGGGRVLPETIGFVAIFYTLGVDFFRMGVLSRTIESGSATVKANLYHAFSDFASTIIALIGFGLSIGLYDYSNISLYSDSFASIFLGFLLLYLSSTLIRNSAMDLSDAISPKVVRDVRKEILSAKEVIECKELKARKVGGKVFVEATIIIPDYIGLKEAHSISSRIESGIIKSCGDCAVTIHIEPATTKPVKKQIESLSTNVKGVKKVHNISSIYANGKLYVTLHAQVEPSLSIEKAHGIAEIIEKNVKHNIRNTENVTVHIEPYSPTPQTFRGLLVDDKGLLKIIKQVTESYATIVKVNRIMTYESEDKRYINIDCLFTRTSSVDSVHNIVSEIEKEIRKKFEDTIVTIHSEPEKVEKATTRPKKKRIKA
jgi:cation diffusion facilitator family transporter